MFSTSVLRNIFIILFSQMHLFLIISCSNSFLRGLSEARPSCVVISGEHARKKKKKKKKKNTHGLNFLIHYQDLRRKKKGGKKKEILYPIHAFVYPQIK